MVGSNGDTYTKERRFDELQKASHTVAAKLCVQGVFGNITTILAKTNGTLARLFI